MMRYFSYLQEHNITTLIHLGDVVDRRKFINYNTAHNFQHKFWKRLWDKKIDTHIILETTILIIRIQMRLMLCNNLYFHDGVNELYIRETTTVNFDGLDILLLKRIAPDIEEESIYAIDNSTVQIAMGHLEIKGFEMHKGHINEHGLEMQQFNRFEKVISGHFHRKSDNGTIYYLGTQYEITWSDYNCSKGFHIFDTQTRELTKVLIILLCLKR